MRMSHSDKGLKTLEEMGTVPEQWAMTPIKWVWEKRWGKVRKECPVCHGRGRMYILLASKEPLDKVALKKFPEKRTGKGEYDFDQNYYEREAWKRKENAEGRADYTTCPNCESPRKRPGYAGTGYVIVEELMDVLVGYPIWPKGVLFDSRFHEARYYRTGNMTESGRQIHSVCELCNKSISGVWSNLVPVNARGNDGRLHGMYVGEDCATKFLDIELVLDDHQLKEIKKSERKRYIKIELTKEAK